MFLLARAPPERLTHVLFCNDMARSHKQTSTQTQNHEGTCLDTDFRNTLRERLHV